MRQMKESGIEWIGQIPEGWTKTQLKYLCDVIDPQPDHRAPTMVQDGGYPYIGIRDVDKSGNLIFETARMVSKEAIEKQERAFKVDKKDILFGKVGTLGNPVFIKPKARFAISATLVLIKVYEKHDCRFVKYLLESEIINSQIGLVKQGSTRPSLGIMQIRDFYVLIPHFYIQNLIANHLDTKCLKIDETIELEKQVIEKLKAYKQSMITEVVTKGLNLNVPMKDSGIEWIGEIPEHWKAIKLKYEFRIKKNIAGKVGYDILSVTQKGIKIKDISNNKGQISMDYSKYQLVDINDYVMNHMDLLTGFVDCSKYVGITSPDYRVFSLINNKNSKEYFKYIFQSCYTNKIFYGLGQGVSGLGRWRLQTDKFLNFSLPIPQIREQDKIASYLNNKCLNIDKAIIQKENLIEKLAQYKKGLIYECVTGKQEV